MKEPLQPLELLDDIYSTGHHEKRAHSHLMNLRQPKGGFT